MQSSNLANEGKAKVIEFPKNASAAVIERGKEIGRKLRELIKSKLKAKQP